MENRDAPALTLARRWPPAFTEARTAACRTKVSECEPLYVPQHSGPSPPALPFGLPLAPWRCFVGPQ